MTPAFFATSLIVTVAIPIDPFTSSLLYFTRLVQASRKRLALGAEVRASGREDLSYNRPLAARALRFPVYGKEVLEAATFSPWAAKVSDGCPFCRNGFIKDLTDAFEEPFLFLQGERVDRAPWMETSPEENFAGVNIADTSEISLVKEEILEAFSPLKESLEPRESEIWGVRVDTKFSLEGFFGVEERDFPKPPWVNEREVCSRGEHKARSLVFSGSVLLGHLELSGHPKVHD